MNIHGLPLPLHVVIPEAPPAKEQPSADTLGQRMPLPTTERGGTDSAQHTEAGHSSTVAGAEPSADEDPFRDGEALFEIIENLNGLIQMVRHELQFTLDDESNRMIVKVIDSETKEVLRQIPREEIVVLMRHLKENLQGGLIRDRV